jgi:hypothetical protein
MLWAFKAVSASERPMPRNPIDTSRLHRNPTTRDAFTSAIMELSLALAFASD